MGKNEEIETYFTKFTQTMFAGLHAFAGLCFNKAIDYHPMTNNLENDVLILHLI